MNTQQQMIDRISREYSKVVPPGVQFVIQTLTASGHTTWLAGGAVRDLLLGRTPKDFDIVTSADPDIVEQSFDKVNPIGKQFGIVQVIHQQEAIEVATFRKDGLYVDGRRPVAVEKATPKEDSERRDFTINAMYYDPIAMKLVDFIGGLSDLESGIIRAVGDAAQRFNEDHLRILRAVRFAATLDFKIDGETVKAIEQCKSLTTKVAVERVVQELVKGFLAVNNFSKLLADFQLFPILFLEIGNWDLMAKINKIWSHSTSDVAGGILHCIERYSDLYKVNSTQIMQLGARLKLTQEQQKKLKWGLELSQKLPNWEKLEVGERRKFLIDSKGYPEVFQIFSNVFPIVAFDLAELQALSLKPLIMAKECLPLEGKALGDFLGELMLKQLRGEVRTSDQAKAYFEIYLNGKR